MRHNRGAELVEFAIVLPLLLVILVAIVDFAFMFRSYEVITNAAREGARVGVLPGYTPTDAQDRALAYLDASGLTDGRRTAAGSLTQLTLSNGQLVWAVRVVVTYPHDFVLLAPISRLFGGAFAGISLSSAAVMRTEAQAGT